MESNKPDDDKIEDVDRRKVDSDRRTSAYAVRISFKNKEERENSNRRRVERRRSDGNMEKAE